MSHRRCCCAAPCTRCQSAEPGAVVSVAGSCADPDNECTGAAGAYSFLSFAALGEESEYYCQWTLLKGTIGVTPWYLMYIRYHPDGQPLGGDPYWEVIINWFEEGPSGNYAFQERPIAWLSCSGGAIVGGGTVAGSASGGCVGCTASVTIT